MTLAVDIQLYAESYDPPPSVALYEFLPRPGEQGQPDPRDTVKEKLTSAPDVLKMGEDGGAVFDRAWQEYLVAINPNMSLHHVAAIMNSNRWGFNQGHGLPERKNYIENEAGDGKPPVTDKDRTFAFNVHACVEAGNELIVTTFNANQPPPPLSVISPQTHPWMYCVLSVVYRDGHIGAFPNSNAITGYPKEATLFPLIATHEIRYPLSKVRRVSAWKMPY